MGNYRILTSSAAELLGAAVHAEITLLDEKLYLEHFSTQGRKHRRNSVVKPTRPDCNNALPLFENMPVLPNEALWDLLELLTGLVDSYQTHYAVELERVRAHRRQEFITELNRQQLQLPLSEFDDTF